MDLQQQQRSLGQAWGPPRGHRPSEPPDPDAHDLSRLPVATAFLEGSSLRQLFFFLPSKLMGNTLSQRETQHFERLQPCTQTTQESSPTLVWGGWQGGRGKG